METPNIKISPDILVYEKERKMSVDVMYNISRACTVYCQGPLLQAVQLSGLFNDSKTFVDMPMIYEPEDTLAAFNLIPNPQTNTAALQTFLNEYFLPAGSDLVDWLPPDFQDEPPILKDMPPAYPYKTWTYDLNQLWKVLGRNISEEVVAHPEKHSFVPRKHAMMVPGGRFRESYYWDSWWIIRGLLVCDMYNTTLDVIENLLDDVENFGFVPNGGRIYYLDRSQPPLLSEMVMTYYDYMIHKFGPQDSLNTFLNSSYVLLQREYDWWMNETNGHVVTMPPRGGEPVSYKLNRYHSFYTTPRPESYAADYENSQSETNTVDQVNHFYRNIRAGAETGWDFSSRWIADLYNVSSIDTSNIVPIELNSIMYKFELNLMKIGQTLQGLQGVGEWTAASKNYSEAAMLRYDAIQIYLFDNTSYHWRDFNISSGQWAVRSPPPYSGRTSSLTSNVVDDDYQDDNISNYPYGEYSTIAYWIPLWAGIFPPPATINPLDLFSQQFVPWTYRPNKHVQNKLVQSFSYSGLIQRAGVLTTTLPTGQQWDSPNAWPPLVLMAIEGLRNIGSQSSFYLAANITSHWLDTCYLAYTNTNYMYEKYNAFELGVGGGGGEYTPQIGFGWSNAVALILINSTYHFYEPIIIDFDMDDDMTNGRIAMIVSLSVLLPLCCICAMCAFVYFKYPQFFGVREQEKQILLSNAGVDQQQSDPKKVVHVDVGV